MSDDDSGWAPEVFDLEKLVFQDCESWDGLREHPLERGNGTLAAEILALAANERLSPPSLSLLREIYIALLHRADAPYHITIVKAQRGPKRSFADRVRQRSNDMVIYQLAAHLTEKMGKREAAVAQLGKSFGISRSEAFAAIRRAKAELDRSR